MPKKNRVTVLMDNEGTVSIDLICAIECLACLTTFQPLERQMEFNLAIASIKPSCIHRNA